VRLFSLLVRLCFFIYWCVSLYIFVLFSVVYFIMFCVFVFFVLGCDSASNEDIVKFRC